MPIVNLGIAPPDPATNVGVFREALGDTNYIELTPPVTGFGDYDWFSDAAITAFLTVSNQSVTRSIGYAIRQLALGAVQTEREIKTDDLMLKNTSRGLSLLAIAKSYLDQADSEEAVADSAVDFFEIVPFSPHGHGHHLHPTTTPTPALTESPQYPGLWS